MKLILHRRLQPVGAPLALAIGNFDGVHRGHQALLQAAVHAAEKYRLAPAAMSFHPLPREFFSRGARQPRLMSTTEKLAAFQQHGIRHAFVPRFDKAFSSQSPEAFIDALAAMQVKWLIVGNDFHFGARRAGNLETLRAAQATHGFQVEAISDVVDDVDHTSDPPSSRVSSTAIRTALGVGDLAHAAAMLGSPYRIVGRVLHGKKLGRTLGYPTANIALSRRIPPVWGVFAVKCTHVTRGLEGVAGGADGDEQTLFGVASLGTNPVVSSENRPHLEVFLFDYTGNLYGQRMAVEFVEKIRDELNFASLDALVVQIRDDEIRARNILSRTNDGKT